MPAEPKRPKKDAPQRSVTDVGQGDYVKIGTVWKPIAENNAGAPKTSTHRNIRTADGGRYSMWDVNRYAKAEDME